jgi:SAM-dependent methyltransferase
MQPSDLNRLLGNIDIYLLDQILKNRFSTEMKILDAGCGEGRNAVYFLNAGFQIFGIDQEELAIQYLRFVAKSLNPSYDVHRFQIGAMEEIPFHQEAFEAVICSAVLHFAKGEAHFWEMMQELTRVLKPGGILWFRMCTGFGGVLEQSEDLGEGKYLLPDPRRFWFWGNEKWGFLSWKRIEIELSFFKIKSSKETLLSFEQQSYR